MELEKLNKLVKDEIFRVVDKTGISISKMSDDELAEWVEKLVRKFAK